MIRELSETNEWVVNRASLSDAKSTYLTGTMTSRLTTALKNESNFDPSTEHARCACGRSAMSMQVAPSASDAKAASVGIASKCCNSWYSEPISIKYLIVHRMINSALNACQMWRLLQTKSANKKEPNYCCCSDRRRGIDDKIVNNGIGRAAAPKRTCPYQIIPIIR